MKNDIDIKTKIQRINSSDSPKLIPTEFLPEVFNSDYFFISYSHKDFKSVYTDLLYLQENKLNVWYDREMAAGSNWEKIAIKYLAPFECKGVIFYVSENALVSEAFIKEVEFAQNFKKPIITIILPFESDYQYEGKSVKGMTFSASKMISILKANNVEIPEFEEKKIKLEEYFPDKVIYLPLSMDPSQKVEQIKLKIEEIPLLEFNYSPNQLNAEIIKVNDPNLTELVQNDLKNENLKQLGVSMAVFSNCQFLKHVDFGNNNIFVIRQYAFSVCSQLKSISNNVTSTIPELYEGAFFFCKNLEEFNYCINETSAGEEVRIPNICSLHGKSIFCGCENLKEISIINTSTIDEKTFSHCFSLEKVNFYGKEPVKLISSQAFECCYNLKEINIPYGLESIGYEAFYCDDVLEKVHLPDSLSIIKGSAFSGCESLKNVILPKNMVYIGTMAFSGCKLLDFNEYKGLLYLPSINNPYFALIKPVDQSIDIADIHKDCRIIAGGAFHSCKSLKEVRMSSNIKSIGEYAFYNCSVSSIILKNNPSSFKGLYIGEENQAYISAKKRYKYFRLWPLMVFDYLGAAAVIVIVVLYGWSIFSIVTLVSIVLLTIALAGLSISRLRLKYINEKMRDLIELLVQNEFKD